MRWVLVDAAPRIMPEIQPQLADFTQRLLEKRGIEFLAQDAAEEVTDDTVTLSTRRDDPVPDACAGRPASRRARSPTKLGLPLDRGRIACNEEMRVAGYDNVWALGDIAAMPDPARPGQPCPPTAQHAIRQGKLLGNNVAAALGHRKQVKPFTFKTLGAFADLGRHKAVANLMGVRVRGFPAWAICRFYHLAWVPGLRAQIAADRRLDGGVHLPARHRRARPAGPSAVARWSTRRRRGRDGEPAGAAPEDQTIPTAGG